MARHLDAKCRLCRREGMKLYLKGERCFKEKCSFETRKGKIPGQHGAGKIKKPTGYALQLREEPEHAAHLHLLVQAAFLRQVAEAVDDAAVGVRGAEHRDRPLVGCDDVQHHPDRARLAGAVRAKQPVHGAARNGERESVDGGVFGIPLRDAPDVEGEVGHGSLVRG